MSGSSNRPVVIISALLTLLVLGGATLAVGFRTGRLHLGVDAPGRGAGQPEVVVSRQELEEAYRALDHAYAQIRALQAAQSRVASPGGDRRLTEHGDDDHRGRGSRRRESDDD